MLKTPKNLVVMGVAGCGKSSVGAAVAQRLSVALIEGDEFHSPDSRTKMNQGIALTDADRAGWLARLADALAAQPGGAVLSCSALKRAYRERLRQGQPGLRFAFLDISRDEALRRVSQRPAHFFSASLVDNQFATLEPPLAEAGVLHLDASQPLDELSQTIAAWLHLKENKA